MVGLMEEERTGAEQENGLAAALLEAARAERGTEDVVGAEAAAPETPPAWRAVVPEKLLRGSPEETLAETGKAYRELEATHTRNQQELAELRRRTEEMIEERAQERRFWLDHIEHRAKAEPGPGGQQANQAPKDLIEELIAGYGAEAQPMAREVLTLSEKLLQRALPQQLGQIQQSMQQELQQQRELVAQLVGAQQARSAQEVTAQFFAEHPDFDTPEVKQQLSMAFASGERVATSPESLRRHLEDAYMAHQGRRLAAGAQPTGQPAGQDRRAQELAEQAAGGRRPSRADNVTPNAGGGGGIPGEALRGDLATLLEAMAQNGMLPTT